MKKITKKMVMGEAISINPAVGSILFEKGIHCIGCGGMSFETIEQGLKSHGLSDKEITKILDEINKKKAVRITKDAIARIRDILGTKYNYLRIKHDGKKFKLLLERTKKKEDSTISESGIKIVFDKKYSKNVKNILISYSESSGGFIVK